MAMWKRLSFLVTRSQPPLLSSPTAWLSNFYQVISLPVCPISYERENKHVKGCERSYITKKIHTSMINSPRVQFSSSSTVFYIKQCCWMCNENLTPTHAFCGKCNSLQPLSPGHTHFEVMGIERNFNIDTRALVNTFRRLQAQFHPDRYSTKSEVIMIITSVQFMWSIVL